VQETVSFFILSPIEGKLASLTISKLRKSLTLILIIITFTYYFSDHHLMVGAFFLTEFLDSEAVFYLHVPLLFAYNTNKCSY
jgi:hypothetical protein